MTCCAGIKTNQGIVMISDSRTNAGVDNVSAYYGKMWRYGVPGERQLVICSAGNLATTQAVIDTLEKDMASANPVNLLNIPTLSGIAEYIGLASVEEQKRNTGGGSVYTSTFLLAGEIAGQNCGLYMVYAEGNYIESSRHMPFLQIGETKYGKPILDRVIEHDITIEEAVKCALISMDATLKSNLSVGPPIEVYAYEIGSLQPGQYVMYDEDNDYLRRLHGTWNQLMKDAFNQLGPVEWD